MIQDKNTPQLSSWSPLIGEISELLAMTCFPNPPVKKPGNGRGPTSGLSHLLGDLPQRRTAGNPGAET